jgi:hypothetical protein
MNEWTQDRCKCWHCCIRPRRVETKPISEFTTTDLRTASWCWQATGSSDVPADAANGVWETRISAAACHKHVFVLINSHAVSLNWLWQSGLCIFPMPLWWFQHCVLSVFSDPFRCSRNTGELVSLRFSFEWQGYICKQFSLDIMVGILRQIHFRWGLGCFWQILEQLHHVQVQFSQSVIFLKTVSPNGMPVRYKLRLTQAFHCSTHLFFQIFL